MFVLTNLYQHLSTVVYKEVSIPDNIVQNATITGLFLGGPGHTTGGRDETNLAHQMLHGGGSAFNSPNRWFDKTIQLIISGDGAVGLCYEHSNAEGVAVIQLVEKLWKHADSFGDNSEVPSDSSHLPPPERLEWMLEAADLSRIDDATAILDNLVKDLDFQVFRFTGYGKDFIKSCKISPDVYIQLALQLAYYRLYGKLTATYESASTRRFKLGRVDCIRSATPEALKWATAMLQPKDDDNLGSKKVRANVRIAFSACIYLYFLSSTLQ